MLDRWSKIPNRSALILGTRRSGKTTVLKERFPDAQYYTLDDADVRLVARRSPKQLFKNTSLVVIDEIQRMPELMVDVKYAIDQARCAVLMTGSSSYLLDKESVETLAGRAARIELPTFCFGEEAGPATHTLFTSEPDMFSVAAGEQQLDDAVTYGGFPEVLCATPDERLSILKNYRDSYFLKDLRLEANIRDADGLLTVLLYIAQSIGSPWNASNAAREAGIDYRTATRYLNLLRASRLVFSLPGYHYGPVKKYSRAQKVYFADNGIITALNAQVSVGQRFENFVVSELEKRRRLGLIPTDTLQYYRTSSGAEIDIIIEEATQLIAVEIKRSISISRKDTQTLNAFEIKNKHGPEKLVERIVVSYRGERAQIGQTAVHPVSELYRARGTIAS